MGRKVARESVMKLLYQMDMNNDYSTEVREIYISNNRFNEEENEYITASTNTINGNIKTIDSMIEKYSSGWNINRLAKVDLSILRVAVYEILFREDIPVQVSINEALEISKKYSTEESSKFINGILGSIVRECNINED